MRRSSTDVVISSVAVASPLGSAWPEFVEALKLGTSGVIDIRGIRVPVDFPIYSGGVIRGLSLPDPRNFEIDREYEIIYQHLLQNLMTQIAPETQIDGIVIGANDEGFDWRRSIAQQRAKTTDSLLAFRRPRCATERITEHLMKAGFRLPAPIDQISVFNTCVSGISAMAMAAQRIRTGRWHRAIVGNIEGLFADVTLLPYLALRVLATLKCAPEQMSRPFSKSRNGFVKAEGGALFMLESRAAADARGATPLASVQGWAQTSDAYRITDGRSDGVGAIAAMRGALTDAQLRQSDIGYINAHGSSTGLNDELEVRAMKAALPDWIDRIPISSIKSQMGHANTACAGIEIAGCIAMLRDQFVSPTLNLVDPDPGFGLDFVPLKSRAHSFDYVLKNSFGFGGANASIILGKED